MDEREEGRDPATGPDAPGAGTSADDTSLFDDTPTAAHSVFAAPTPAEATFATDASTAAPAAPAPAPGESSGAVDDAAEVDDEDDDDRRGVSFATKALVIGAAWVLLVLFLIGQFKGDGSPGPGPVGLDQSTESAGGELTAGEVEGGEEPVDVDGDGEIEPGEPGYGTASGVEGASAGGAAAAEPGATSGSSGGSSGGGGATGEGGSDGDASPIAVPGGTGSTTTTAKAGGGSGTSTTTSKPGGGGGGGSSSTTTAPSQTTAAPTATDTVELRDDTSKKCVFSKDSVGPASGSISVTFRNTSDQKHTIAFGGDDYEIAAGDSMPVTFTSTTTVSCRRSGTDDTLVVTVT